MTTATAPAPKTLTATVAYTRFEFKRLLRNRQNVIFSMVFPLIMFVAIAAPQASHLVAPQALPGVTFGRFYFAGLAAFGMLAAVISGGARIALERQVGWNRQLRLTPLPASTYLRTKLLTSYAIAVVSLVLLTVAALLVGSRIGVGDWLAGAGLSLVALIPFAAMGVALGHLVKGDSMGPFVGGAMSLFSLVGGAYFPITDGILHTIAKYIPSYWLVQANKIGIGGQSWTPLAWVTIAAWTVAMGALALWAYRRDTARA